MLITLLFGIGDTMFTWLINIIGVFGGNTLAITDTFITVMGYSIYIMGSGTFLAVASSILFWTVTNITVSIAKFVIGLIPFI